MTNSKKVPTTEDKENLKNKNLFKRFKINLETFEIEKSDFNQKLSDNKHDEELIPILDNENENSNQTEKAINEFKDEHASLFKENNTKDNNHHQEYDEQESLFFKQNELIAETLPLSSKIKEIISNNPKRKFPFLSILGLVIGMLLIVVSIMILLGNSERVVDSVASGETNASSILICFIGVIFIVLSLLKLFPKKKAFGNLFHTIKDFESELDNEPYEINDEINHEYQDEEK